MLAFHNDEKIKEKYLTRVRQHREADNLIQGDGWDGHRGCAIGCTFETYDHSRAPIEIGMPEWLAQLEDTIFEGLPFEIAKRWPERLLSAIKPGVDLEKVKSPFIVFVLESTLETFDHTKFPEIKAAIEGSIAVARDNWTDRNAALAAADAAHAAHAAYAADATYAAYAAYAAYAVADAADATDAAYAAAYAAYAAYAVADAAYADAADAYEKFAAKLIEIVEALDEEGEK